MILFANCVYTVVKRYNNGGCFRHIAAPIFFPSIAAKSHKMTSLAAKEKTWFQLVSVLLEVFNSLE